jgi:archaellum biogenesis ATPase FlaH
MPQLSSGNQQLDHLLGGGVEENKSTILVGDPGSGKTCAALEFLTHEHENAQNAAYICIDKKPEKILSLATQLSPKITHHITNNTIKFVEISTQDWDLDDNLNELLLSIQLQLDALFEGFNAQKIIIDSLLPQVLNQFPEKEKQYFILEFLSLIHTYPSTSYCILYDPSIHNSLWLNTDLVSDQLIFNKTTKLDYTTYWLDISKNCINNQSGRYRFTLNNRNGIHIKHRVC